MSVTPDRDMEICERNRFHEAGHVFIIRHVGVSLERAFSQCDKGGAGATTANGAANPVNIDDLKQNRPHDLCMIAVAGYAAEKIASGRGLLPIQDLAWATPSATNALRSKGAGVQEEQVDDYIEQVIQEVEVLLQTGSNWACVQAIAERLAGGEITGDSEVDALIAKQTTP